MFDDKYTPSSFACFDSSHKPCGSGTDDNYVVVQMRIIFGGVLITNPDDIATIGAYSNY
jgi:hypothetical protein